MTLRRIIRRELPEMRRMSLQHKQMCGCEICVSMHSLHKSLNGFRHRLVRTLTMPDKTPEQSKQIQTYKDTVLPNGESWHKKARQAIKQIQCPAVATCGYPHWRCVLQRCPVCPNYPVPFFEREVDKTARTIKFHLYCKATKCSNHGDLLLNASHCDCCNMLPGTAKKGRVRTRKYLTLLTKPIGIFMQEFYIPLLWKYAFHLAYV